MARRRRGHEEHEMRPLLNDSDESFTEEAGLSTGSDEKQRLMVLGGDDALMDKACGTILGYRESRDEFNFGELKPRTAQVCGRQVSVLKTPSYWLERVKSFLFFSRKVKAIRNEIESYESMMFPGPHAFLLVHRDEKNSGKEYYLLRALSEVFGKEVLDYCMVLFIDQAKHNDPKKNSCVKMCGGRNHILHNTDDSVNELFNKTRTDSRRFFIKHLELVRAAKNYFEAAYEEKEYKLRRELAENKETAEKQIEQLKINEKQLQNNLTEAKRKAAFLNQKLQSECNIIQREQEVQAKEREINEREKELEIRERELKDDKERLQKQIEQLKDNEKQLQNDLTEAKREREKELDRAVKELDDRERKLEIREKELEIREREVTQRDVRSRDHFQATADPAVSGDKISPLDEREGQLKSRDDSQASGSPGTQKPVRRNSKELEPPLMSEHEHRPLHTL